MSRRQDGEVIIIDDDSTSRSRSPIRQEKEDKIISPPSEMDIVIDEQVKEVTGGEVNEVTGGEVNEVTAREVNEVTGGEVIGGLACLLSIV